MAAIEVKPAPEDYKQKYEKLARGFLALEGEYKALETALQSAQLAREMTAKVLNVASPSDLLFDLGSPFDGPDRNLTSQYAPALSSTIREARDLVRETHPDMFVAPCSPRQTANDPSDAEKTSLVKENLNGSLSMDIEDSSNAIDALTNCTSQRGFKDAGSIKVGGSCAGSASPCARCPIRFLNQQNPKEIAAFFEEHKHELPRSHELCIKRFQDNAEGVRSLDAKYGDLVNMIYGLGLKHKPLLPEHPEEKQDQEARGRVESPENRISKWANTLQASEEYPTEDGRAEERVSHFDRPLKDIRVGESPSRPWGEPYKPKDFTNTLGPSQNQSEMKDRTSLDKAMKTGTEIKAAKCPFQHLSSAKRPEIEPKASDPSENPPGGEEKRVFSSFGVGSSTERPQMRSAAKPERKAENFPLPENKAPHDDPNCDGNKSAPTLATDEGPSAFQLFNHGTAIFNSLHHLSNNTVGQKMQLVNHGYLIVGYDGLDVQKLMTEMHHAR
ncbi:MAG: hypothetical protein M1831_005383 [Alyxoria varia]|nr:MAG: hypothetical protein M1831_005383 [Alyxoria varia]